MNAELVMHEDKKDFIPDTEEKKHYTLAEAVELIRKREQENVSRSDKPVSTLQDG